MKKSILLSILMSFSIFFSNISTSRTTSYFSGGFNNSIGPSDIKKITKQIVKYFTNLDFVIKDKKSKWMISRGVNKTQRHLSPRFLLEKIRTKLIIKLRIKFIDDRAAFEILQYYNKKHPTYLQIAKKYNVKYLLNCIVSRKSTKENVGNKIHYQDIYTFTFEVTNLYSNQKILKKQINIVKKFSR